MFQCRMSFLCQNSFNQFFFSRYNFRLFLAIFQWKTVHIQRCGRDKLTTKGWNCDHKDKCGRVEVQLIFNAGWTHLQTRELYFWIWLMHRMFIYLLTLFVSKKRWPGNVARWLFFRFISTTFNVSNNFLGQLC